MTAVLQTRGDEEMKSEVCRGAAEWTPVTSQNFMISERRSRVLLSLFNNIRYHGDLTTKGIATLMGDIRDTGAGLLVAYAISILLHGWRFPQMLLRRAS